MQKLTDKSSGDNDENIKGTQKSPEDIFKIIEWIQQLKDPKTRESSLCELSKMREEFSNLAIYLWYSPGIVATL
jgi:hypothetical protein